MAARFWIGGAANTNWNENTGSVSNWSATSGGTIRVAPPTVSDDVTFDGVGITANGASVISATISVLSLTFAAGYTNTVTKNAVLTIAGNFTDNTAHTWAGASGITISAASTITSGGKTFSGPVTFTGANTKTLGANWTITGLLTCSGGSVVITSNTLTVGGLTATSSTSGTAVISIATGTWQGAGVVSNSLTLAAGVTVSGTVNYSTGTLTGLSAITTTSSTLSIGASSTLDTSGVSWNNIILSATLTLTINSIFTVTGTMTINSGVAVTFAGTAGWTVGTLTCSLTGAFTQTLVNNVTYTITTAFNCFLSRVGAIVLFTSDHATNKAILTLNNGATCNVLASFTRIDASNGRAIWTFNGVVTTCFNIISLTDLSFVTGKATVIQGFSNY